MVIAYPTLVLAILFLTGLALDTGNLMLATLSLQGATDAAVVSGLRSTLLGNDKDEVEDLAKKVLIANLRTEKWDEDRLNIDVVDLRINDGNFKLGVSYDRQLWLMSALSSSGSSSSVTAYAEGQTPEVQMAVIIDSSYSSRDPRATGVPRLTYSLGVFLDITQFLRPSYDHLLAVELKTQPSIVRFPRNNPTQTYTNSKKDFDDLRAVFTSGPPYFKSTGNTDIGSSIELARYQLEQIPNPSLRPLEVIVLLSDGQADHALFRLRGAMGNIPNTNPGPHRDSGKNYFLHEWESGWNFDHIQSLPGPKDGLNPEGMYKFFGYRLFKPDHTPLSGEQCLAYVALPNNMPAGTYHTFWGWSKICLYRPNGAVDRDACDAGSYDNCGSYEGSNRCCVANQPSNPSITIGKPGGGNLASNIPINRKNIRSLIVEQTIAEADYARQRNIIVVVGATDFVDDASKMDPNEARYASTVNAMFLRRLAADPAAIEVGDPDYEWVSDVEAQLSTGNGGAFIHADYMQSVYSLMNSIYGKLRVVLYE